jgi:hypothetical protein
VCGAGWADCDGLAANGCEVDINTTLTDCGACGNACSLANVATHTCAAGSCGIGACSAGWSDCDGSAANGCELDLASPNLQCAGTVEACKPGYGGSSCTVCAVNTYSPGGNGTTPTPDCVACGAGLITITTSGAVFISCGQGHAPECVL